MALAPEIYREFEAIVGPAYISDREYILAALRQPQPHSPFKPVSPVAVLLPETTEQVQAIVRVCNRHGLRYIATVSSLISFAYPNGPNTIILHLKRMNRIVEINERDRYAVIESGVRHGQLRTELMRYGLSYPVASVGPGGSVLANFACSSGDNHVEYGTSRSNRYLAGIEWVTPTGEILRLGSLATHAGWFNADGPGPSLRGLIKGFAGQWGGLGVVTRIAIGLDAWKGPPEMPTEGRSPRYRMRLPADCHKVLIFKFPTLDQVHDAMQAIGRTEIGFSVMKYFNASAALLATESANEFWELWNSGLFQRELARPLFVYLSTWSAEELAYEERVLHDIIAETGGEPVADEVLDIYRENMDFFVLVGFLQRVLRLGGAWAPTKLGGDSVSHMFEVAKAIPEFFDGFIARGQVLDAPDNFMITPAEYGHQAHIELLYLWDRNQPDWAEVGLQVMRASLENDLEHHHHGSSPPRAKAMLERLGPRYSNCHVWIERLKAAFDPNDVSNPMP
ncbi:MAG: FAD-binding oxidoreductase [Gammaproteobacteria bacterium]|nr:FAD-binding oxidoreductase [Gammaproteobacteria bacterium]